MNLARFWLYLCATILIISCSEGAKDAGTGEFQYDLTVQVSGLDSGVLVLQEINSGQELSINFNDSLPAVFPNQLSNGTSYNVQVITPPDGKECGLLNAQGSINRSNVDNLTVACFTATRFKATARGASAELTWISSADQYDIYYADHPITDENAATVTKVDNITSPYTVRGLQNNKPYYFKLQANYNSGYQFFTREVFAKPDEWAFDTELNRYSTVVSAMDVDDNGTVYVGGDFQSISTLAGGFFPFDPEDGGQALPYFPKFFGTVNAVIADGQGGWYVGGNFARVDDYEIVNLAHILPSGRVDKQWQHNVSWVFQSNGGLFAGIQSLAIFNGKLVAGGSFIANSGAVNERRNFLALSLAGQLDESIKIDTVSGSVYCIAVVDNNLLIGGNFLQIDTGTAMIPQAALYSVDNNFQQVELIPSISGFVERMFYDGTKFYLLGRYQERLENAQMGRVSAYQPDGTNVWDVSLGFEFSDSLVADDNHVYIGGWLLNIGGTTQSGFAAIDKDTGAVNENWGPDIGIRDNYIAVHNGNVYIHGIVNGVTDRQQVVKIDSTGQIDSSWELKIQQSVTGLIQIGGKIFAHGNFGSIHTIERHTLVAINQDGSLRDSWNVDDIFPRNTINGTIRTIKVAHPNIYVGGDFDATANNRTYSNAIAFDQNGSALNWYPRPTKNGFSAVINDIEVLGDTIYLGGTFDQIQGLGVDGTPSTNVYAMAAVNSTSGGLLPTWDSQFGLNDNVVDFELNSLGSVLYVAGTLREFTKGATTTVGNFVALNTGDNSLIQNSANFFSPLTIDRMAYSDTGLFFSSSPLTRISTTTYDYDQFSIESTYFRYQNHGDRLINFQGHIFLDLVEPTPATYDPVHLAKVNPSTGSVVQTWEVGEDAYLRSFLAVGNKLYIGGKFSQIGIGYARNFTILDLTP